MNDVGFGDAVPFGWTGSSVELSETLQWASRNNLHVLVDCGDIGTHVQGSTQMESALATCVKVRVIFAQTQHAYAYTAEESRLLDGVGALCFLSLDC